MNPCDSRLPLDAELREALECCVHCGLCLESCPTYGLTRDENESPRGRIRLIDALNDGVLAPEPETVAPLDRCLGCRACEPACPSGVSYGAILERARAAFVEPNRPAGRRRLLERPLIRHVLPFPERLKPLARLGGLTKRLRLPLPAGMARALDCLPAVDTGAPLPEWTPARGASRGVVALLVGCAGSVFYGPANTASVFLISLAGYDVWVPRAQGCCGAIAAHDGDEEGAARAFARNAAAFAGRPLEAVVTNAAGCGAQLGRYEAFAARPGAPAWPHRTEDLTAFLGRAGLPPPAGPLPDDLPRRVTYHDPCHLAHAQGVTAEPRRLLQALPGVTLLPLRDADRCCGGAGSYALTQPALSDALLDAKGQAIAETGAELVLTVNPPCLAQLGRLGGRPVRHLAAYLARAHGWQPGA